MNKRMRLRQMEFVYLDHNSTTPVSKEVIADLVGAMSQPLNPSSVHAYGRKAKLMLENQRRIIIDALKLDDSYQVIFTATGTESNNLALRAFPNKKVLSSTVEHHSVINVVSSGEWVPVLNSGVLDLEALQDLLLKNENAALFSIMYANNETGVVQPMNDIIPLVKKHGCIMHTDASQALGKVEIEWGEMLPDIITISAHKFGGPQGVAALVYNKKLKPKPMIYGGGQEFKIRPGTHNLAGIMGFGKACTLVPVRVKMHSRVEELRNYMENAIREICPDAIIFGFGARRLPNTSSISMPGVKAETQVINFDLAGFAISAGSACSSGKVEVSHVHMAMGYNKNEASSAIRVSLGPETTLDEINKFIAAWQKLYNRVATEGEKNE